MRNCAAPQNRLPAVGVKCHHASQKCSPPLARRAPFWRDTSSLALAEHAGTPRRALERSQKSHTTIASILVNIIIIMINQNRRYHYRTNE